jgi:hypothetical protein
VLRPCFSSSSSISSGALVALPTLDILAKTGGIGA